jgi:hypothetical protein
MLVIALVVEPMVHQRVGRDRVSSVQLFNTKPLEIDGRSSLHHSNRCAHYAEPAHGIGDVGVECCAPITGQRQRRDAGQIALRRCLR